MPKHPLFAYADTLARRARQKRAIQAAKSDPHLARDIGLPYRPRRKPRDPSLW